MAQATPRGSSTDDPFNAYIDKDLTVQGAASGPLQGLTFAAKDLFDVRGGHEAVSRGQGRVGPCEGPIWGLLPARAQQDRTRGREHNSA